MMYRIGIDLGGTNIAVGVVDDYNRLISRCSLPTGAHRGAVAVMADMGNAVAQIMDASHVTAADLRGIGIGSPGTCDSENGIVVRAYNLNWFRVPVCQPLQERFGVPVRLNNDANCAALAETIAGNAIGCKNVVLITLGTGVGGGIIIDGQIYAGMRSLGAELGHTLLVLDGERCTCGRRGCWEAYASVTALIRQARLAAAESPASALNTAVELTGEFIFDAAGAGDTTARAVIARWYEYIGAGLTDIVNTLAPEMILIGGGVSRQGEILLAPLRTYVTAHCFGGSEGAIPQICAAALHGEAGIIGAAALIQP